MEDSEALQAVGHRALGKNCQEAKVEIQGSSYCEAD